MARRISFINYKGGVGKTSLIVNVAACLAHKGYRVLLVDLDTQSNASIWLMRLDRWNAINNRGDGSIYNIFDPGVVTVEQIIQRDVLQDKNGQKVLPGLDLIPTTFSFVDLEQEYTPDPKNPPYALFFDQLAKVEPDYDYILFDCPPNLLKGAQCGLFASNEIYVPSNPDALSLIGFTLLVDKLMLFHGRSASFRRRGMGPPAQIRGILFNAVKANIDIQVPKMRMQLRLNQFRNQRKVVAKDAKIFEGQVRDAVIVRRAVTLGLPVILIGQAGAQAQETVVDDYSKVADELVAAEAAVAV